ncbi:hypothetical protein [Chryseotalea sanaruensis]|uniref:hypothetical protein n=1 Tax=Chryseotalea sanaruensis TaxID=2482724 RepID=UPI001357B22A|nr:hypothetical protein [Chryseotalea sanaruensis]
MKFFDPFKPSIPSYLINIGLGKLNTENNKPLRFVTLPLTTYRKQLISSVSVV